MAEWLRRLTRNQLGLPAQVRILSAASFVAYRPTQLNSIFRASSNPAGYLFCLPPKRSHAADHMCLCTSAARGQQVCVTAKRNDTTSGRQPVGVTIKAPCGTRMHTCTHAHARTCTCTCTYTHMHTHARTHARTHTRARINARTYTRARECARAHANARMRARHRRRLALPQPPPYTHAGLASPPPPLPPPRTTTTHTRRTHVTASFSGSIDFILFSPGPLALRALLRLPSEVHMNTFVFEGRCATIPTFGTCS